MSDTLRLQLPLLAAAQAQKHVTHNEALLRLDALSNLYLKTRGLSAPPAASEGECYLVADAASGDWIGQDGKIALWRDGTWHFLDAFPGLAAFVEDEGKALTFTGGAWQKTGGVTSSERLLVRSEHGAETRHLVLETELSALSGAYVDTAAIIPNRAIVFGVSSRTVTAVTGAASYDCGLAGEPSKFGGSLGVSEGASNVGVIGPTAFYADTALRLTASGGDFTGGAVRLAVHCLLPVVPES